MDMQLSAPVHYDAYVAVELVDEGWLATQLPVEDVAVGGVALTPPDDDDASPAGGALDEDGADGEFKWPDLHTLIEQ